MIAAFDKVETVAHVIQIALTPVFLFSGVATLLSVLSIRLGRVADRVDRVSEKLERAGPEERRSIERRLAYLQRRSVILDAAVILAALAGMSTLLAAGALFVDGLRDSAGVTLFVAFGAALLLTIGALAAFLLEMMLASGGIRRDAASAKRASPPNLRIRPSSRIRTPKAPQRANRNAAPANPPPLSLPFMGESWGGGEPRRRSPSPLGVRVGEGPSPAAALPPLYGGGLGRV